MIKRGTGGKIVNVSSMASHFAIHDHVAYSTSKNALNGLTKVRDKICSGIFTLAWHTLLVVGSRKWTAK